MNDAGDLVNKARELGKQLSAHPRVKAFIAAQDALRKDGDAQRLMMEYREHMERMQVLEMERKPVEVADKRKVQELESRVAGNETLKTLMRAQADYFELMNSINGAIDEGIFGAAAPPAAK
jgi:cell fate (sporulation/competence/biofilm development) regulator YlbF (YheA/YmcA/DUF963 family)